MRDDPGHRVAAAVIVAEDLGEKAPDGSDGTEDSVAVTEAILVESVEYTGFAQGVGEGQSLTARKAGADLLQSGHERPPMSFSDRLVVVTQTRTRREALLTAAREVIQRRAKTERARAGITSYITCTLETFRRCS